MFRLVTLKSTLYHNNDMYQYMIYFPPFFLQTKMKAYKNFFTILQNIVASGLP